jgi:hypothetical protein
MKSLQYTSEIYETLKIYVCNMRFQRSISLLLGRMEVRRRVKFTAVEIADGSDFVALVEEATQVPVEKAATIFCVGGARAMRGVRSAASCAWVSSIAAVVTCAWVSFVPATASWAGETRDVCNQAPPELP